MLTINNVIPLVIDKLRGRSDLAIYNGSLGSDIPSWIHHAINDLTPNFPFEELVVTGPYFSFIVGQSVYKINYFLAENGPQFQMPRSFFRYFTTNNPPISGDVGSILKGRTTPVVYPMSNIPGLPTYWCQNGPTIMFGFNPDQAYCGQFIYQRKHPFNMMNLPISPVYMPPDWQEVLAYAAAIKGCDYLGMDEIGMGYYKMLHGDPKKPGNIGLLAEKKSQLERNITQNERQLQPVVHRYC